jgi:site-specific DNA-cytosine methylase
MLESSDEYRMERTLTMIIDLCSGLGRWSEEAISIDIDPKTRPTIVADVKHLPLRQAIRPKLIHASPPCKYLSNARARRYGFDEKGIAESLDIIAACFRAFDWLEPEMWTLENPLGVLRRLIQPTASTEYKAGDYKHKKTDFWSNNKALKRAMIPQEVRQRILSLVNTD